jgi:hypothetical protein
MASRNYTKIASLEIAPVQFPNNQYGDASGEHDISLSLVIHISKI